MPQVRRSGGHPEIAVAGSSYGGGLALLLAGTDNRIRAVAADITWNNLNSALFPNAAGNQPGVFKKMWAGYLFQQGQSPAITGAGRSCGRFAADVCAAYQQAARDGTPDAATRALLDASSPSSVAARITAPTLLTQGEQDSLFPLGEADANARAISAHGTPVRVQWRSGGHDSSADATGAVTGAAASWFTKVFAGRVSTHQRFDLAQDSSAISASDGTNVVRTATVTGYPGLPGSTSTTKTFALHGAAQTVVAPAGGVPAAITSVPGIGSLLSQAAALVGGLGQVSEPPGQLARFRTDPAHTTIFVAGRPTVTLTVTANSSTDATLFLGLHDVGGGTDVLPSGLVAPLRLTGLTPGRPRTVTVQLPTIARQLVAGHRLELTVATTDLAYALPLDNRTYTVALGAGTASTGASTLQVPDVTATVHRGRTPLLWLGAGVLAVLLAIGGVTLTILRRRRALHPDPELADVPVSVEGLVKEYADGYRAVDGISFRVERGQVVGLLGPNGAGKTTALRILMGLITATEGIIHVFGQPVRPGSPVLARVGAFIEGPGFLPHLSGRDNLRLYWRASGRPDADADFDTALEIAGLGDSIDRKVRTYSQGMRQRLGIAQAMLGLPELLILDEPTNGLDPPQIAEMREVLQSYAATGRTVVVSSHLLSEVEQTCTHVVVMHHGRLVAAGTVGEVAGEGGTQLQVAEPGAAIAALAAAGITAQAVPARRALEDVFLDLVGSPR